jgi:hypothetical protein
MIRSPVDLLLSTARAIGAESEEALTYLMQEVHTNALTLGQWIFVPPGVQGWAHYRGWINATTLTMRHDATNRFIDGIDSFYLDVEGDIENEPTYHHGRAALGVTAYCRQFESYSEDPAGLVADIAGHLLAYPASGRLLENLLEALLQGQPDYEWRDVTGEIKEQRLRVMLKLLMHSPNYQLM